MAVELITQAEYARRRGVDPTTVRDAVRAKRITLIDGKIDPEVADIQWSRNTRARVDNLAKAATERSGSGQLEALPTATPEPQPATAAPAAPAAQPANDGGYSDARTRREKAEAEQAELRTAQLAGRLVDRSSVESAVFEAFRALRDRIMNVPPRAAPKLSGMQDVREIELLVAEELRKAIGDFERQATESIQSRLPA